MTSADEEGRSPDDSSHLGRPSIDAGRRRFVGRGTAAPVMLTFTSSSVMAQTCFTPSAAISLHPSGLARHSVHSVVPCNGASPAVWGSRNQNEWPGKFKLNTRFSEFFKPELSDKNMTFASVLQSTDPGLVAARASVATLLNVAKGDVNAAVLGGRSPRDIWTAMNRGGFVPYTGARVWSPAKVAAWLATTWGEPLPPNFASLP